MEIQQLQYFVTVVEKMNISRAAEQLNISQPSLSNSVMRLEHELGQQLFTRERKRLILTRYGAYFLGIANTILEQVRLSREAPPDSLRELININLQAFHGHLMDLLLSVPGYGTALEYNISCGSMVMNMSSDHCDFLGCNRNFMSAPFPNFMAIDDRASYVVLPVNHPLTGKACIAMSDLTGYHDRYCFIRNGNGELERVYSACIAAGLKPDIYLTTNNTNCKFAALSRGELVGFISEGWVTLYEGNPRIAIRRVHTVDTENSDEFRLYWKDDAMKSPGKRVVIEYLQRELGAAVQKVEI